MKSSNIRYLPQVDHLRGVAALWVLFYHGEHLFGAALGKGGLLDQASWTISRNPFWALIYEGHTGVALFMVLSGFIFAYGALGHRIQYGRFIGNRFLRIYPLYLTIICVTLALDRSRFSLESFVITVLPLADFQPPAVLRILDMAWTVAVEFQFYLIFPFLMSALNAKPIKTLVGVLVVALSIRVLACADGANPRDLSYWHLFGRIDQFLLGMFAAYLVRTWAHRQALLRALFWCSIPVAVLAIYCFHLAGGWPVVANWKIVWPTIEGSVWALLILGYVGATIAMPQMLSSALARVGEISFSIYLLHYPIIDAFAHHPDLLPRISSRPEVNALIATVLLPLPCTLALSWVTFRVIESPFHPGV